MCIPNLMDLDAFISTLEAKMCKKCTILTSGDLELSPMTFISNRVLRGVNIYVHTNFDESRSNCSRVIVVTKKQQKKNRRENYTGNN